MAVKFTPKVLSANNLIEGDVIYWNENGDWVSAFEDALYLDSEKLARHVLALANKQLNDIVGPYLADAELGPDDKPKPAHFREAFRTTGPSNYHHGKQAEL
jgi:hypothetical protein